MIFFFQRYYISFINTLTPDALGTSSPLINWPQWTNSTVQLLDIGAQTNNLTRDDFRSGAYEYLASHVDSFRV